MTGGSGCGTGAGTGGVIGFGVGSIGPGVGGLGAMSVSCIIFKGERSELYGASAEPIDQFVSKEVILSQIMIPPNPLSCTYLHLAWTA